MCGELGSHFQVYGGNDNFDGCNSSTAILTNPMKCVRDFQEQNQDEPRKYEGDLEADYLNFLAKVQKAAKENPVDVEFDFSVRIRLSTYSSLF